MCDWPTSVVQQAGVNLKRELVVYLFTHSHQWLKVIWNGWNCEKIWKRKDLIEKFCPQYCKKNAMMQIYPFLYWCFSPIISLSMLNNTRQSVVLEPEILSATDQSRKLTTDTVFELNGMSIWNDQTSLSIDRFSLATAYNTLLHVSQTLLETCI